LAVVSLLAIVAYAIFHSFDDDRDFHIPAEAIADTERARTAQLGAAHV
jgi:cytochrome o ubiquinol oxidase subunit 1